jgi:hypothetical protein
MPYKYLDASLSIHPTSMKEEFIGYLQQKLDEDFYNSTDSFTIQEEYPYASGTLRNVDVRINHVINTATGLNQGDDWKKLLFKDLDHPTKVGDLYYFDNNYWLCINAEAIKSLTSTCIIRRCSNTLRWIDEDGGIQIIPCILNYKINENRDYSTAGSSLVNPSGILEDVLTQFNPVSNLIRPNQRFLIGNPGNWACYKVPGGGINNFNNLSTMDNMSAGLLRITVNMNYINYDSDDLVNGIADALQSTYAVKINEDVVRGNISHTAQLTYTAYLNESSVDREVVWATDNPLVATVNSSGLVTFIGLGVCNVICKLKNNETITDSCQIRTESFGVYDYQVKIDPDENFVLEGDTKVFSVYLTRDGVQRPDTFTFAVDSVGGVVPTDHYVLSIVDGNHFSVQNKKMWLSGELVVNCVCSTTSRKYGILLKGGW